MKPAQSRTHRAPRRGSRLTISLAFLFSLALCGAATVRAQVVFDNTASTGAFSNSGLTSAQIPNFTVAAGTNRILYVGVSTTYTFPLNGTPLPNPGVGVNRVTDVRYNGVSMTRIGTQITPDLLSSVETFRLVLGTSGSSTTANIDVDLLNVSYVVVGAMSFSNVHQGTPIRSSNFASGTATNVTPTAPTVAVTPVVAGDVVVDTVVTQPDGGFLAVGPGQTEQWNGSPFFSNSFSVGAGSTETKAPTTTMSWQPVTRDWAIGAAAIQPATPVASVVISEFRFRGSAGGNDEFIELYNRTTSPVVITGYRIYRSNNMGSRTLHATIGTATLGPGCHYLLTNSNATGPYNDGVGGDQTYGTGITDDGGIALALPTSDGTTDIIDQVGLSAGSAYKEGSPLPDLGSTVSSNIDRSYEREPGGTGGNAVDTNDNLADFNLRNPSAPQSMASTCIGTTYADLSQFTVQATGQGVSLGWETSYEVDNLGFNVYREKDGRQVRVNPSLIAGSALLVGNGTRLTAGFSYSWFDAAGEEGSVYWLEDVDLSGARTLHGPVAAAAGDGAAPQKQTRLLSQLSDAAGTQQVAERPAAASSTEPAAAADVEPLSSYFFASRPGVKISVNKPGWYRVTQPELAAAGLTAPVDTNRLQLYADGVEQAVKLVKPSGAWDASAYLEFYGAGLDTPSTDTRTYWLIRGSAPGKRVGALPTAAPSSTLARSFQHTIEVRERALYFSALRNGDGENFFGRVLSAEPLVYAVGAHHYDGAAPQSPVLEVSLQGVSQQPHRVKVVFNGRTLGRLTYEGQEAATARLTMPRWLLREGGNEVRLVTENGEADVSLVDTLRLTYSHFYRADGDRLFFTAEGAQTVRADGFTNQGVRVFDITTPGRPQEVLPQVAPRGGLYSATFKAADGGTRTFVAFTDNLAATPLETRANLKSTWSRQTRSAEMVIITHKDFRAAVTPLERLRRAQGRYPVVVDVEDIYDEFSYGAHSPQAVRDFLMMTAALWSSVPRFVLLVGDGSYDPRNYQGRGQFDFVPTKMIDTRQMETASDDWFADFDGDGVPEMAVGRLPVQTAAEAERVVAKIVNYSPAESAGRGVLLVADRAGPDGYDFAADSDALRDYVPDTNTVQSLHRTTESAEQMRAAIIDGLNQGQLLANWVGHGSFERWTGDGVLRAADVPQLANSGKPAFVVTMTCMNGYYHSNTGDSLAEALMKVENGGAVAVWASSGLTLPAGQAEINRKLYEQLFAGAGVSLGDAVRQAKAATSDADTRRTWILFGDPTMRLR